MHRIYKDTLVITIIRGSVNRCKKKKKNDFRKTSNYIRMEHFRGTAASCIINLYFIMWVYKRFYTDIFFI